MATMRVVFGSDRHAGARRGFLRTSVKVAGAFLAGGGSGLLARAAAREGCPADVRAALSGPWPSLRTPFDREGNIDYAALRKLLDFLLQAKAKAVVLTWGDSLYSLLTKEEIAELTRTVVRHVSRRAFVVAADSSWWTGKTVEFGRFCRDIGADMLMVKPPDWAGSTTVDSLVAHFGAVAEEIPVMLVTNFLGPRSPEFAREAIMALYDRVPRLWAVKDDLANEASYRMCEVTHDRWTWSSGGSKQKHLALMPHGGDGYLSLWINFKPKIAWRYWRAIEAQDMESARAVVRDFDAPLFEYLMASEGSFDAAIHGIYELFGLTSRFRRAPYHSLTDAQMERLATFLRSRGIR